MISSLAVARAKDAPTTRPATQPATQPGDTIPIQPDSILGRMLQNADTRQPLGSEPNPPAPDATSGMAPIKQPAPRILLKPEGNYVIGRMARLGKVHDGFRELIFNADGQALRDPPMRILPNQLLSSMEDQTRGSSDPMAFRISGYITQYKDRNYILIDKAVPEARVGDK